MKTMSKTALSVVVDPTPPQQMTQFIPTGINVPFKLRIESNKKQFEFRKLATLKAKRPFKEPVIPINFNC